MPRRAVDWELRQAEDGRSAQEDFFEEGEGARVIRLPQPEHGLLAHCGIAVGPRHLDQQRHALVLRELAQRKNSALLHFRFGVIFYGGGDGAGGFFAGLLTQPK